MAGRRLRAVLLTVIACALVGAPSVEAHTLSYSKAKRAVQKRANAFAGQATEVNVLFRQTRHRFYGQARWARVIPNGCKGCGYDPVTGQFFDTPTTQSCFAELVVRLRSKASRRTRTRIVGHACF